MKCRCTEIDSLDGVEAQDYAREHLQVVSIDADNRQTEYVCRDTGKHWLEDRPYPVAHGDGPPRLRAMPLREDANKTGNLFNKIGRLFIKTK